ncbi:hypothetical protein CALVIDRAFT_232386 [Calocera viscosa TUFC12733]|uniref:Uncharacterized protein n=1 Tax=Calocera viscosa (strain TUFC12733) TaxID=1330018 RepID=A0A167JXB5_CALVF|nr:hypothetical protein CALVIDRAFT_232386 [Calocera viscosa TUFC12733]
MPKDLYYGTVWHMAHVHERAHRYPQTRVLSMAVSSMLAITAGRAMQSSDPHQLYMQGILPEDGRMYPGLPTLAELGSMRWRARASGYFGRPPADHMHLTDRTACRLHADRHSSSLTHRRRCAVTHVGVEVVTSKASLPMRYLLENNPSFRSGSDASPQSIRHSDSTLLSVL